MLRLLICLVIGSCLLAATACTKNNYDTEAALYGTWVKGSHAGDTLWFMRKDGKHIMRSNQSFNASLPNYKEEEYSFRNGKLMRVLPITSSAFGTIDSFVWIEPGKKFELLGYQLYMFMSSTQTKFVYVKQ